MPTLCVPDLEGEPWPTLGPEVVSFIRDLLVHGPGDLLGEPAQVDAEFEAEIWRMYEVYPKGHPRAGRRRFKRAVLEERKGTAKTERAAWLAIVEAHPDGPVRCDGFRKSGGAWVPVGRPVRDPYVPMVAYTEEQTEELAFGAVHAILSNDACHVAADFDVGLERVVVLDERGRAAGKIVPLAGSPNARDGARTTFQHFDETHRFTLKSLRNAHTTMLANIPKRPMADPWSLETTTAYTPGEGSVAEDTREYAEQIAAGKIDDPQLFYFSRWAGDEHDIATDDGLEAAIAEATGAARMSWTDVPTIMAAFREPNADVAYLERVWLNRRKQSSAQAFDPVGWAELAYPQHVVADGALVVIGFDGARRRDATAMVATEVITGHQFVLGIWERPELAGEDWQVDEDQVTATLDAALARWDVWRVYCDPPHWDDTIAEWRGTWGDKTIVPWFTNRTRPMALALKAYRNAQTTGELTHDGDAVLAQHIANAQRRDERFVDDDGVPLWTIRKDRPDSWRKIDGAMAGCLSWEARRDAITAGVHRRKKRTRTLVTF